MRAVDGRIQTKRIPSRLYHPADSAPAERRGLLHFFQTQRTRLRQQKNQHCRQEEKTRIGGQRRRRIARGDDDLLHLIIEVKGYRGQDAIVKKETMETYWVPGVNNLGVYGRWAFAELTDVFQMESDFAARITAEVNKMIESSITQVSK